jgi:hypothetical protein
MGNVEMYEPIVFGATSNATGLGGLLAVDC